MRIQRSFLVGVFLVGTLLSFLPKALGIETKSFIAPGAENYVFELTWGSQGNLNDEFNGPEGVAVDKSGNVWVADTDNNRIMEFDANGNFLSSFGASGSGDGQFNSPHDVAADAQNNIWVADTGNNRVQKFTHSGKFLCKNATLNQPHGLAVDQATGNVFVANTGANAIVRLNKTCVVNGGWGSFGSNDGEFNFPHDVTVDTSGRVYVADFNNNRIQKFKVNSDGSATFILKWGVAGSGDSRFTAFPQFSGPVGITADNCGDIYVVDHLNARVQKFKNNGTFITMWGWSGSGNGQFDRPVGIAVNNQGIVYVADRDNHRIQRFSPSAVDLTHLFKSLWGVAGTADGAFNAPVSVAVDPQTGDVYVSDFFNNRIQKFDAAGTFLRKWGSTGSGNGQFSGPAGVAVDPVSGEVYVSDLNNNRIQKFTSEGVFVIDFGLPGTDNGEFNKPINVAVDPVTRNFYVADRDNHRVQEFNNSGGFIRGIGNGTTWTGTPPTPAASNLNSGFNQPHGLAVDKSGNLYVADFANQRVQKFNKSGGFLTKWGSNGLGNGQFSNPRDVSVDGIGNVYVIDYSLNHRVQKFKTNGRFITKWGSLGSGGGALPGLFFSPQGVAVNPTDNFIYVVDTSNNRIQRFERFGFSVAGDPPSQTIVQGDVANYDLNVSGVGPNTLSTTVSFCILSGKPPKTTAAFTPASIKPSPTVVKTSTLTLDTDPTTPKKTYTIFIEVEGGGQTRVISVKLTVQ